MNVKGLYQRLHDKLWDSDPARLPPLRHALLMSLRLLVAVGRDIAEGRLDERAASLAYTTLVSFVPLLAVLFAIMKAFGIQEMIEPTLKSFLAPLGRSAPDVANRLVDFVDKIQVNVLGYIGVAMLLYGVFAMIQKVEEAFNDVWRVDETRSLPRRLRDYIGVLLIGPALLLLSVAMTAAARHMDFVTRFLNLAFDWGGVVAIISVLSYALFMLAFTALYMLMPAARVKPRPALVAGLVTGIVWKVMGKLFGVFVSGSASYAAIYSAFAAMVLFMIWVYAGWIAVLAGAAFSYYLQHPSNMPLSRSTSDLSLRLSEKLALQLCVEVGRALYKKEPPPMIPDLAARLEVPELSVRDMARDLVAAGILKKNDDRTFMPGSPFDTTSVNAALVALRAAGEAGVLQSGRLRVSPAVDKVLALQDRALQQALSTITLKQLALGNIDA